MDASQEQIQEAIRILKEDMGKSEFARVLKRFDDLETRMNEMEDKRAERAVKGESKEEKEDEGTGEGEEKEEEGKNPTPPPVKPPKEEKPPKPDGWWGNRLG